MITKKQRTQAEILEAAKSIIHDTGHTTLTVRNLAKLTGFSYTNIYYYFKDLNALMWNLRLNMIDDMIVELSHIPSHKEDAVDEVLESLNTYINYFFKNPNVFRFFYFYSFIAPIGDDSYQKLDSKFGEMWQSSFYRLIQEKIIQPQSIEVVAKTLIYSMQGMIMLSFSSNGSMTKVDIQNELAKIVNNLIRN